MLLHILVILYFYCYFILLIYHNLFSPSPTDGLFELFLVGANTMLVLEMFLYMTFVDVHT